MINYNENINFQNVNINKGGVQMSILDEKAGLLLNVLADKKIPLAEANSHDITILTKEDIDSINGTLYICLGPSKNVYTDVRMLYPILAHEEFFKRLMDIASDGKITKILVNPGMSAYLVTGSKALREIVSMIEGEKK
jgi:hypothetical protein